MKYIEIDVDIIVSTDPVSIYIWKQVAALNMSDPWRVWNQLGGMRPTAPPALTGVIAEPLNRAVKL